MAGTSGSARSGMLCSAGLILLQLVAVSAQFQRPSAAYAPLFTGLIKFTDVPAYGTPEAPTIIQPTGRKRRNDNYPAAPELSSPVLERLYSGEDGSTRQRRRLQQQQLAGSTGSAGSTDHVGAHFDYAAAFAASYAAGEGAAAPPEPQARRRRNAQKHAFTPGGSESLIGSSSSGSGSGEHGRKLQQDATSSSIYSPQAQKHFDYAAAFAASYTAPVAGGAATAPAVANTRSARRRTAQAAGDSSSSGSSAVGGGSSSDSMHRRRLQQQQKRPFDYAAAFAASYAPAASAVPDSSSSSGSGRAAERRAARAARMSAASSSSSSSSSSSTGARKLQQQQAEQVRKPFDYAAAFAASYAATTPAAAPAVNSQRRAARRHAAHTDASTAGRKLQQQQSRVFDYAAAFAASYTAASQGADTPAAASKPTRRARRAHPTPQHDSSSSDSSTADASSSSAHSSSGNRKLQQAPAAGGKQRPGWTGLWWADAGGVGVAAGPSHAVHTISTVMALYTLDPASGVQVGEPRVVALQDLFAPVGAANCKEGVYDAVPLYDKAAKRYILAATCGGKGAVLLAATATPDPTGPWFLFMLLADAAETAMACTSPKESAVADAVRVTYDANGVYLSLFNYCPSSPATQGTTLLALPKHKVYKGAPNFVYAAFSADQVLAALPQEQRQGLAAANFRQCGAAPPQWEADAAGSAAYFVCDQAGADVSPRGNFTLLALINTGALWQFVGTRPSSPTPFLAARLVDRGGDAPLRSAAMLQQPERGSYLQAGGTKPTGFWSGAAVLAGGKVYAVDRIDVTSTPEPPGLPVTLPSLMWSEVSVQVSMSGAGDCTKTSTWGSNWDWTKDWSIDWGKDFDKEWKDNKNDADSMRGRVDDLEDAIRKSSNCTVAADPQQQGLGVGQVSDGSAATVDGRVGSNCSMSAVNGTELGASPGGSQDGGAEALPTAGGRKLAGRTAGGWLPAASSSNSSPVAAAWLATQAAAQCTRPATELMLQPLQFGKDASGSTTIPTWVPRHSSSFSSPSSSSSRHRPDAEAAAAAAEAANPSGASLWEAEDDADGYDPFLETDYDLDDLDFQEQQGMGQLEGEEEWQELLEGSWGEDGDSEGSSQEHGDSSSGLDEGASSAASRRLSQVTLPGFIAFDVGCWYCYYGKGFYYSSTWFYKYWYTRNAWGFGWYRRYKRNYAPGWSRPSKFIGHRRHLLDTDEQQHQHQQQQLLQTQQQQAAAAAAARATGRALLQAGDAVPAPGTLAPAASQLQNETILVPPCLLSSTSYKNTCKQCNYSRLAVKVTVTPTRRGQLNATSSANPLGFLAPTVAVTPGGSLVVIAGYAGPNNHPNSSAPAYPGVGSFTIPPGAQGLNATWKVLRTGVGKVKSPTGRWSDFSSSSVTLTSSPNPVPGLPDVTVARVYYGVQWAQREVQCAEDELEGDFEFEPVCAMPAPWIGVLAATV